MKATDAINEAISQIGVTEYPPNSNEVIYNDWYYGRHVSGSAYPWCCTFIVWLFRTAPKLVKKTASCSDMYRWFRDRKQIVNNPMPGDLVFFNFNNPGVIAQHIGIVIQVNGTKDIYSVEGNTSNNGSQDNGGAVLKKHRTGNIIVGYARPLYEGTLKNITKNKTNEQIAKEVIKGKWGTGASRKIKLANAGYNYKEIQSIVNEMLKK